MIIATVIIIMYVYTHMYGCIHAYTMYVSIHTSATIMYKLKILVDMCV